MPGRNLVTEARNTWCPGCGNFAIQHTLKKVLGEMESTGKDLDSVVLVTGIGCHAKIADYLNINSFYAIHGRTLPVATGIKLANPDLTVICHAGDGDALAEGLDHLIFAAKRNLDVTFLLHDNRVYGLTTGQYTPTSPFGFRGRSTPNGSREPPINPLELMLVSGATFLGRAYTRRMKDLEDLMKAAIFHKGFAFIDILQICASFYDLTAYYDERVYPLSGHNCADFAAASQAIREWDYTSDEKIPLGLFYQQEKVPFDPGMYHADRSTREEWAARVLGSRI